MNMNHRVGLILGALIVAIICSPVISEVKAQPLVSGGLIVYYDFDQFSDTVFDGSGNGFNGKVQDATRNILDGDTGKTEIVTTGIISNDHSSFVRGGGAIRFGQSSVVLEDPVFVDMDGSLITANHPELVPATAVTFAAWVNLAPPNITLGGNSNWNSPAGIVEGSASSAHGIPHFQAEGDGKIRFTIRDSTGVNIVNSSSNFPAHPYPNQPDIDANGAAPMTWPTNTWFHVAATWDQATGKYSMYYNGRLIRNADQLTAGPMGLWDLQAFNEYFDGLGIGCVYDSGGRRLHGLMDELYIFRRALNANEIGVLANLSPIPEPTSCGLLLMAVGMIGSSLRCRRKS